jgi:hypothetical protein
MPRLKVLTVAAAWLGMMLLGQAPHAKGDPLITVCPFDMAPDHRQSCVLGYAAMYQPGQTAANCQGLWERESAMYGSGSTPLNQSDYLAACEAAKRELTGMNQAAF